MKPMTGSQRRAPKFAQGIGKPLSTPKAPKAKPAGPRMGRRK